MNKWNDLTDKDDEIDEASEQKRDYEKIRMELSHCEFITA